MNEIIVCYTYYSFELNNLRLTINSNLDFEVVYVLRGFDCGWYGHFRHGSLFSIVKLICNQCSNTNIASFQFLVTPRPISILHLHLCCHPPPPPSPSSSHPFKIVAQTLNDILSMVLSLSEFSLGPSPLHPQSIV